MDKFSESKFLISETERTFGSLFGTFGILIDNDGLDLRTSLVQRNLKKPLMEAIFRTCEEDLILF